MYVQFLGIKIIVIIPPLLLQMDVNVILVDNDVVFFADPMPYFRCADCDIHFQNDERAANSCFYYARSGPQSLKFFIKASRVENMFTDVMGQQEIFRFRLINMV